MLDLFSKLPTICFTIFIAFAAVDGQTEPLVSTGATDIPGKDTRSFTAKYVEAVPRHDLYINEVEFRERMQDIVDEIASVHWGRHFYPYIKTVAIDLDAEKAKFENEFESELPKCDTTDPNSLKNDCFGEEKDEYGNYYLGEWKNNNKHGFGFSFIVRYGGNYPGTYPFPKTEYLTDKALYKGDFKNNVFDGHGKYFNTLELYDGQWEDGERHGEVYWENPQIFIKDQLRLNDFLTSVMRLYFYRVSFSNDGKRQWKQHSYTEDFFEEINKILEASNLSFEKQDKNLFIDLKNLEYAEVTELLRGPKGTEINLTISPSDANSKPYDLSLVREELNYKGVVYSGIGITSEKNAEGVIEITETASGGPAENNGLKPLDKITRINHPKNTYLAKLYSTKILSRHHLDSLNKSIIKFIRNNTLSKDLTKLVFRFNNIKPNSFTENLRASLGKEDQNFAEMMRYKTKETNSYFRSRINNSGGKIYDYKKGITREGSFAFGYRHLYRHNDYFINTSQDKSRSMGPEYCFGRSSMLEFGFRQQSLLNSGLSTSRISQYSCVDQLKADSLNRKNRIKNILIRGFAPYNFFCYPDPETRGLASGSAWTCDIKNVREKDLHESFLKSKARIKEYKTQNFNRIIEEFIEQRNTQLENIEKHDIYKREFSKMRDKTDEIKSSSPSPLPLSAQREIKMLEEKMRSMRISQSNREFQLARAFRELDISKENSYFWKFDGNQVYDKFFRLMSDKNTLFECLLLAKNDAECSGTLITDPITIPEF